MRRLWSHNSRARGSLSPPERKPPLLPGTSQVLRQKTFQVQQQQLCEHAPTVQLLI